MSATARRILVLYTGGTIGMAPGPQGLAPMTDFAACLQAWRADLQDCGDLPAFEVRPLAPAIDSASLRPAHWPRLARTLTEAWDHFDGFVVLHGTDTLAWSAAALSCLLRGADKPVILTGSQIPWQAARSDAPAHLEAALRLAADARLAGVTLCFGRHLWPGARAVKWSSQSLDAFAAPNDLPLADLAATLRVHTPRLRRATPPRRFREAVAGDAAVAVITVHPGLPAQTVRAQLAVPGLRGAVLCSYGLGNLPEDPELLAALAEARDRGVMLVNRSQCPHGGVAPGTYASSHALQALGVLPAGDLTLEAAFAKLQVLLAEPTDDEATRRAAWFENWAGEWGTVSPPQGLAQA
ncbi:asparaginase [Ideonella livida]|uniref:Asparaginase n=1 Tax=Ideonella livida TaxID=2707176 RepID=A0A7C9TJY4_9BURK|nr:asparaginase [Ideonella livida]NDY92078.1 asparaginase [Ideonella livida]